MSVVGRLKEELSGVGLKVWTMCLRCSWSTSIRDTCTMEEGEREGLCVCVCVCARMCVHVICMWFLMFVICTWLGVHACVDVCTHTYFVFKRPLQERVKFSSHENEEDREVSLVANTITI